MKILFTSIRIPVILIILFLLFITTAILVWWYTKVDPTENMRLSAILSGLTTGFAIMIVQLCLSAYEYAQIEKITKMGVKKVLPTREGKEYYARLINSSKQKIDLMGYTADRFMQDFGRSDRPDSNALRNALNKNVIVRLLIIDPSLLKESDKHKAEEAKKYFSEITSGNFEYRYYTHQPTHSILTIDDECLIGPYFPDTPSSDTPCLQISTDSPFVKKYMDYFEKEWLAAVSQ